MKLFKRLSSILTVDILSQYQTVALFALFPLRRLKSSFLYLFTIFSFSQSLIFIEKSISKYSGCELNIATDSEISPVL